MKQARKFEKKWKEDNPEAHPVEWYKDIAKAVVNWLIEDGVQEVEVLPCAYNGGIPEYSFALVYVAEEGINIKLKEIK